MSRGERLVRPDGKREQRIPACKAEKAKRAKGGDHNGREGHAQVVQNQTDEQSRQPDLVTGQVQKGRLSWPEGIPLETKKGRRKVARV